MIFDLGDTVGIALANQSPIVSEAATLFPFSPNLCSPPLASSPLKPFSTRTSAASIPAPPAPWPIPPSPTGEKFSSHRLLRSVKNRFGSTDELRVFEMSQLGLQAVSNPSEMFLSEQQSDSEVLAGLAVAVMMDGSRTFLIEIQVGDYVYFKSVTTEVGGEELGANWCEIDVQVPIL
ncbi:hypothetical protein RHMOL_Rhmol10G0267300 [Rhododendron molle]|uniref:Uncharacterized protein n=1 Tax=Rhododendron molle TaxID=49168 RepID=A0ACC0M6W0_RHOML|nr:hypothetical protein RHMOL_Rhmol10G0267300 [Rhododendron molle]